MKPKNLRLSKEYDNYIINYPGGRFKGSLAETLKFSVKKLGFKFSALEKAVLQMHENDHNSAKFDSYGKFTKTENRE